MLLGLDLVIILGMTAETETTIPGFYVPSRYFLTAGEGAGSCGPVALDQARFVAGLGEVNIIKLSSIVGPSCRKRRWVVEPGSTVGAAFAQISCSEAGRRIASAVAVAHPTDQNRASLVMEHHGFMRARQAKKLVVEMARAGLLYRGLHVRRVESIAIEHVVGPMGAGATFAAVVEL